ncbi:MAG TPA: glycosyltransferase family 1 protein [Solirubrobacteraceae bacterium]|nr:glycosyltransferase family 1 protein [Solirubrobacteraceae bacterium]
MHVGLNLVFLVPGETGGMEVYARELARRLAARDDLRVTAFVSRAAAGFAEADAQVLDVDPRNRVEWVRGEQQHLPRAADRARCDVVHSLASTAPWHGKATRVTTIHDLNYKLVPDTHFGLRGLGMRLLVPAAARRSHRLIAISQSTRRDLVEHLKVPGAKIDVVPQGAAPPGPATPEPQLRARLGLGDRPVILSASAKRPHKNVGRLLDALGGIPPGRRPLLVVPGYPTPYEAELRERARTAGVAADVIWPAWLDDADLEGLHALATLVAFPSLSEGFGLPVLEAMLRGVPVACSDRSSLPEVAGDAALLFDPEDTDAIRAALERLLGDAVLRADLIAKGRERAKHFTWERTADGTAAAYARALSSQRA